MAAKKKKAAKKAVKKVVKKVAKKAAGSKIRARRKPETLRLRNVQPGFTVNDIDKSIAWYTNVLGFVVADPWMREGKLIGAELRAGAGTIYLGQDDFAKGRDRVKGQGVRLYCSTAQSVDDMAKDIKGRGGKLDHEPITQPWGTRDFGITDPDGYKITIGSV